MKDKKEWVFTHSFNRNMAKKNIASQVRELIQEKIEHEGFTLWDVSLYKEGRELILEVSIDRPRGVNIDDCTKITNIINPEIDRLDPIEESYSLMVSSAGLERELKTDSHLEYAVTGNKDVIFKLFATVNGTKELKEKIISFDKEYVNINGSQIPRKMISKMTISEI